MEVYAPGTRVKLAAGVEAVVLAVKIQGTFGQSYECAWWSLGQRHTAWIDVNEIEAFLDGPEPDRIGFKLTPRETECGDRD